MNGDEIALLQDGVHIDPCCAIVPLNFLMLPPAEIQNAHVESVRALRNLTTYSSHSDNAQCRVMHVHARQEHWRPRFPIARPRKPIGLNYLPRRGEQKSECEVRGSFGKHAGSVADRNAARRAGGHIDVVIADRHLAYHSKGWGG